jgi:hypothetical protein
VQKRDYDSKDMKNIIGQEVVMMWNEVFKLLDLEKKVFQ